MGFFGAAHGWGESKKTSLPKICHTYPTMMKLGTTIPYLKEIKKIYESRDATPDFYWHQLFFSKFCCVKKYMYTLHFDKKFLILLTFLESIKIALIKKVTILVMPEKNGYLRSSENKGILKKGLWRHNLCLWRHQQNFLMWFNLYCRCCHVIKVS